MTTGSKDDFAKLRSFVKFHRLKATYNPLQRTFEFKRIFREITPGSPEELLALFSSTEVHLSSELVLGNPDFTMAWLTQEMRLRTVPQVARTEAESGLDGVE
jgi:hypothetical protein